jgi:hypothetical protein
VSRKRRAKKQRPRREPDALDLEIERIAERFGREFTAAIEAPAADWSLLEAGASRPLSLGGEAVLGVAQEIRDVSYTEASAVGGGGQAGPGFWNVRLLQGEVITDYRGIMFSVCSEYGDGTWTVGEFAGPRTGYRRMEIQARALHAQGLGEGALARVMRTADVDPKDVRLTLDEAQQAVLEAFQAEPDYFVQRDPPVGCGGCGLPTLLSSFRGGTLRVYEGAGPSGSSNGMAYDVITGSYCDSCSEYGRDRFAILKRLRARRLESRKAFQTQLWECLRRGEGQWLKAQFQHAHGKDRRRVWEALKVYVRRVLGWTGP